MRTPALRLIACMIFIDF